MMAISIRQPWVFAIMSLGKRVENRSWATRYRGPILLHAAKGLTKEEYDDFVHFWVHQFPGRRPLQTIPMPPSRESIPRGGIVGRAEIIDCIRSAKALPVGVTREQADRFIVPWFFGPVGIVLAKVEPLPFVPCKGAPGLFEVPDDLVQAAA